VDGSPITTYMSTCGEARLGLETSGRHPSDQIEIDRIRLSRGGPGKRPERAMWGKKDWQQFFEISTKRPWNRRRPPRPVYSAEANRITPAVGFSLSELDDAGINIDQAETFGLPVDAARIGAYGPNVSALREFARSARRPA